MNPYEEGQRDARKWYQVAGDWHYPSPRNDYEHGWNGWMASRAKWRAFWNGVFHFVAMIFITALIYILLILT